MASKKKKKDKQPEVPSFHFDTGTLKEPSKEDFMENMSALMDKYPEITRQMLDIQLQYQPQLTAAQVANQTALYNNMSELARAQGYGNMAMENQLLASYSPQFRQTYKALGKRVNEGLSAGYELGDELTREVEQGIRGAQTARGNYLGPAPTAQEAMGKGAAAVDRYNQRIGQAQNYLQGNNPITMMGAAGQAAGLGTGYYPNSQIDVGLGAQGFSGAIGGASSILGAESNFNNALLGAFNSNTEAGFNTYDRTYEQYLERLAVKQGLFSQPSVGGGGGGAMQLGGAAIGAVGAIGGGLLAF